jgi:hypothetical protein
MSTHHKHTHAAIIITCALASMLSACAHDQETGAVERITIDSEPHGANVYVADKPIGVTPLAVVLDDVFPMRWTGRTKKDEEGFAFYRRLAKLTIKKDGCEPYSAQVTGQELTKDINITLKCDPNYKPETPAATTTAPVAVPAAPAAASLPSNVEQRLQNLEGLKQKGLITEEEYRVQRQRILGEL